MVCGMALVRSPMAAAIWKHHNPSDDVVALATMAYHVGRLPNHRVAAALHASGYSPLADHRSVQLRGTDLWDADRVLCMDVFNLTDVARFDRPGHDDGAKVSLLGVTSIVDPTGPYGDRNFTRLLHECEDAILAWSKAILADGP
ncbi:MAG: hypothetical protein ACRD6B_03835 [Bryobacteraceae bacterium]